MAKELKIGIFAVITLLILYFGFRFLIGIELFSSSNRYYVLYEDIEGLQKSTQIKIRGLAVGRVSRIKIDYEYDGKILVTLDIDKHVELTDSTIATITSAGLLGEKIISLELRNKGNVLESGGYLVPGSEESLVDQVESKADPLIKSFIQTTDSIRTLISHLNILQEQIGESLKKVTENANQLTRTANASLLEVNQLTGGLNERQEQLGPILEKTSAIVDSLSKIETSRINTETIALMGNLNQTLEKLNSTEGSAGLLLNDRALYENLNQTMIDLDRLFLDLQQNPKRYVHLSVFGRKDRPQPPIEQEMVVPEESSKATAEELEAPNGNK